MNLMKEEGGVRHWYDPAADLWYEQRVSAFTQSIRLNAAASDAVKAAAEQTILDEVSSRAAAHTDEPLVHTRFRGWTEEELIGDDGFVFGWILVGVAESYYWPTMDPDAEGQPVIDLGKAPA